jgi:aspartyl-tRNA(Asn)/glutamyl-tRNA(Gln) amidotransferase subunit C
MHIELFLLAILNRGKFMNFTIADLKKIARLARLSWPEEELGALTQDMQRIVDLVDQLRQVDVEGVKPMSHAGDRSLALRADGVHQVLGRVCVESSQGYEDGLIRVPKIID